MDPRALPALLLLHAFADRARAAALILISAIQSLDVSAAGGQNQHVSGPEHACFCGPTACCLGRKRHSLDCILSQHSPPSLVRSCPHRLSRKSDM